MREAVLFEHGPDGVKLIGRRTDPDLVDALTERIVAERRRQLAELGAHIGPAPEPDANGDTPE